MPDQKIAELLHELIVATRIMANEKVLDAFGHVSVRHPGDPKRYFIPRHRAPELAEISDIVELNLDSEPVKPTEFRLYSERVIHGEIYKARPEVNAVVHHHAHAVLPFAISGREMVQVFHLGAVIGQVPFWDQRDEFGDTNMLVIKPEEGASGAPHVPSCPAKSLKTLFCGETRLYRPARCPRRGRGRARARGARCGQCAGPDAAAAAMRSLVWAATISGIGPAADRALRRRRDRPA